MSLSPPELDQRFLRKTTPGPACTTKRASSHGQLGWSGSKGVIKVELVEFTRLVWVQSLLVGGELNTGKMVPFDHRGRLNTGIMIPVHLASSQELYTSASLFISLVLPHLSKIP